MDSQPTAPREIKLPAFIKNLRVNGAACQKPPKMRWAKCDWLQLLRGLPRFEDLSEQNWDGCPLCWVSTDTLLDDPKQIAIVLCCPALVRQVFKRLHNTEHIKLCGDGTFNMMRDAWVLLSLGVISKRFRRGEESHLEAFRSHFTGFMFCIANKESKHTYGAFFSACKRVVSAVSGIDLAVQCKQYHADWHKGEEIARTAEFHSSIRVGDYAHFVGATTKASRSRCTTGHHNQPGHEAQMKWAWRTGIYETIQRAAPSRLAGLAAVEKVKPWVEATVAAPTLLLFHVAWLLVLQDLESSGFAWCSTLLQKYCLIKLSANDAREQWKLQSWPGSLDFVWYAHWWLGLQRVQPGTAGGSQAQESWHKNTLKAFIKHLRRAIPDFVQSLTRFCEARRRQLVSEDEQLVDIPPEPWPVRNLMDSKKMFTQARSGSDDFIKADQMSRWDSPCGTIFFAMRHHQLAWDGDRWVRPSVALSTIPTDAAQYLGALLLARSEAALQLGFAGLGATFPLGDDMQSFLRAYTRYVIVAAGPAASRFWQVHRPDEDSKVPYTMTICGFCREFVSHLTCEHCHAAFKSMDARVHPMLPLDDTPAVFAQRRGLGARAPHAIQLAAKNVVSSGFYMV